MATYGTKGLTQDAVFSAMGDLQAKGYTNANDVYNYMQRDQGLNYAETYPLYQQYLHKTGQAKPTTPSIYGPPTPQVPPQQTPAPQTVAQYGGTTDDLERAVAASVGQGYSIADSKKGAFEKYGVTEDQWNAINWSKVPGGATGGPMPPTSTTGYPADLAAAPAANGSLATWATDPTSMTSQQLSGLAGPMQGATTYTPSDNALVSNNLTKLLASDNPYMTLARTKAKQYANSRGLLNSSMAAGAGERAAIESALPIAQQDASTFFTSERDNAGAKNTFARDANAFGREGALMTAKAGFDRGSQREGQTWKSGESALDREFSTSERLGAEAFTTGRDAAQFANRLTEISAQTDAQIKLLDKQQGTNLYSGYRGASQSINDDYAAAVARINESDMDADVKQAQIGALQQLTEQRQNFLNTLYSNSPQWADEWSMFAVTPGEATAGGA